ncbi:MAG: sigma 54-interacting transcriptional regulator [Desulfopila sp.]
MQLPGDKCLSEHLLASQLLVKAREKFAGMQEKQSSAEQYECFSQGVRELFQAGEKLQSVADKRCFIQLATNAFKSMCSLLDHTYLMIDVVSMAKGFAISIGDSRSAAICNFQLSALFLAFRRLDDSKREYTRGLKIVRTLGDKEIYDAAALHGLAYHTIRGNPQKVLEVSSQVYHSLHQETVDPFVISFAIPVMALAAAFTGQFRLGLRLLVGGRQVAQSAGTASLDLALQAQLGFLLAASGDLFQARQHIEAGLRAPQQMHLPLSRFWIERNYAYLLFAEGDLEASYKQMHVAQNIAACSDGLSFYHAPWLLEMLYAFHLAGFEPIHDFEYKAEIQRIVHGANIHLKGTAFRLMAQEAEKNNEPIDTILSLLERSRECLQKVGGKMELAKTLIDIGRVFVSRHQEKKSEPYISEAWTLYTNTLPNLFPGDLYPFVRVNQSITKEVSFWPGHRKLMELLSHLDFSLSEKELLQQLLGHLSTFWGGERSFLLKCDTLENTNRLEVVCSLEFLDKSTLEGLWIFSVAEKSVQGNQVIHEGGRNGNMRNVSLLCIPFMVMNEYYVACILTSYRHLTQEYSESKLLRLADHVGLQLSFVINKFRSLEKSHQETIGILTADKRSYEEQFVFHCEAMKQLIDSAKSAACLDVPILVLGETGVGKEVVAKYIHKQSNRSNMPFVTVDLNCTAESLIESELFGYEKGAFTGAEKQRKGYIELANDGTLFIDEIGDISLLIQTKLLRVLQEKTFKRLGSARSHFSNFRLIVATNRNLKNDVKNKQFREDLYHRINVIPLLLPPLRDRGEDIIELAEYFLQRFSRKHSLPFVELDAWSKKTMIDYAWPGNIRELKNRNRSPEL